MADPESLLLAMFDAAVAAADPHPRVAAFLPEPPSGRLIVVGAGKASARMAQAVEEAWTGRLTGLVITPPGQVPACSRIELVEAVHPVDTAGARTARRVLDLVSGAGEDDTVLALISGGGSAMLALPAPGITFADKRAVTSALRRSGAPMSTVAMVRKHLSAIKGGRLAAAAFPARTVGLLVSDVPGDDPAMIACGPTVPERSSPAEALAALRAYGVRVPRAVCVHLERAEGCPGPFDQRMWRIDNRLVVTAQASLEAAATVAREAGVTPIVLGDAIEGEAREVGVVLAGLARQVVRHGQPRPAPCVLLSGGKTTVTVRGTGRGGRNAELLLSLAIALRGLPRVHAISADTDGVDGAGDAAGALIGPHVLHRARDRGVDPLAALAGNDAHTFFAVLGAQVVTGPTTTDVNDFRAVLISDA
jgi:hydroxypyruvate reductase